jgi:antitoxin HicB
MREHGLNHVTLARKLGKLESEVRRMLDLDHSTKIDTLEGALHALGRQITSEVKQAA